ncbi:MAG: sulfotransferase [bacterium]
MSELQERLLFVIGSPRSGSTLLERMLSSHSMIAGGPEPHIITPLAHLGYYDTVQAAPYDHLRAVDAIRGFVAELPNGEADYLDALRAYTDVLYGRTLAKSGKERLLDKTPAYALVLPFLSKLYPRAKYVVLTRHPAAIFCSFAESFFEGDFEAANRFNPILDRYVPAIARFLRERPVPIHHVRYEDLVADPEARMREIFEFLGVPFEADAIEYGKHERVQKGLGDPTGVGKHTRPNTESIEKWARQLAGDEAHYRFVRGLTDRLDPADLATWGFDKRTLYAAIDEGRVPGMAPRKKKLGDKLDRHTLERWLLLVLRRNIHRNAFGRLVTKVRFVCDVLLR